MEIDESKTDTYSVKKLLYAFLFAAIIFFISITFLELKQSFFISSVVLIIFLWSNQGLPLGIVSLLPIVFFPSLDILPLKDVTVNYAHPVIFLFLGGFLMAIAVEKTDLHRSIANFLLSIFPSTPTGLIYSVMIASAFLSSLLSNTTIALMLYPVVLLLNDDKEMKIRLLLATAYGASIGGILTPVGTPPNLILLGFLESNSVSAPSFVEWMVLMFPVVIPMLAIVPLYLSWGIHKIPVIKKENLRKPLTPRQKKLALYLSTLFLLLIANAKIEPHYNGLGLNEKLLILIYGLMLFLPGMNFLKWEDTKKIPFEILYLFGAGFSIASAFLETDMASVIISQIRGLDAVHPFLLLLFSAAAASFITEVTSNTAFISFALPLFYEISRSFGLDESLLLVITVSASYAFMLPVATPPNAIIMSGGLVSFQKMARTGFVINILGILIVSFVSYFIW
ncbi:MAG: SLC13 family permease [Spirochaetia bacterium]|nr:SLC13 family permease [Spirochaetia bacterium]